MEEAETRSIFGSEIALWMCVRSSHDERPATPPAPARDRSDCDYLGRCSLGHVPVDDFRNVVRDPARPTRRRPAGTLPHGLRPLTRLSYFLDAQLYGMHAAGFLSTNLVLHAITAAARVALARRRLGTRAALAAATAVCYPAANAEVVAYVSGDRQADHAAAARRAAVYDQGKRLGACCGSVSRAWPRNMRWSSLRWCSRGSSRAHESRSGVVRDVVIATMCAASRGRAARQRWLSDVGARCAVGQVDWREPARQRRRFRRCSLCGCVRGHDRRSRVRSAPAPGRIDRRILALSPLTAVSELHFVVDVRCWRWRLRGRDRVAADELDSRQARTRDGETALPGVGRTSIALGSAVPALLAPLRIAGEASVPRGGGSSALRRSSPQARGSFPSGAIRWRCGPTRSQGAHKPRCWNSRHGIPGCTARAPTLSPASSAQCSWIPASKYAALNLVYCAARLCGRDCSAL